MAVPCGITPLGFLIQGRKISTMYIDMGKTSSDLRVGTHKGGTVFPLGT